MKQYRKQSENRIERTLESMPDISPARSKQEVYNSIQKRAGKHRLKRKRVKPAIASAAAILLIILLYTGVSPFDHFSSTESPASDEEMESRVGSQAFQDEAENRTDSMGKDDNKDSLNTEQGDAHRGGDHNEGKSIEEPVVEVSRGDGESKRFSNYVASLSVKDIRDAQPITIPLLTKDQSLVVPLTFTIHEKVHPFDAFQTLSQEYTGEEVGLAPAAIQTLSWDPKDRLALEAKLKDSFAESGKLESDVVHESMEEITLFLDRQNQDLEKLTVTMGDYARAAFERGNKKSSGYFVYTTEKGVSFLVNGNTFNSTNEKVSFADTLSKMQSWKEDQRLQPPIPKGVTIDRVIENGKEVLIRFSKDSKLPRGMDLQAMIDAILFTAADFGFEEVMFEGTKKEAGDYDFTQPLAIPAAPNYMESFPIEKAG